MKKSVILFIVLYGTIACAIVYVSKSHAPAPIAAQPVNPIPDTPPSAREKTPAPKTDTPPPVPPAAEPVKVAPAVPMAGNAKPADSANPVGKAVDGLLSARNQHDKTAIFDQMRKDGQLDQAVAELKQRAADNPGNPEIPTTIGEALLNKIRTLAEAGPTADSRDEMGILAMQADQSFNTALKIDPQNWEAQFVKAASMTCWPADPARDADIAQRLSSLIDQQENMIPNPAFAQTCITLGNQYQKMGQPDKAQATWQLGLTKFPNDPALQKKLSGP